MFPEVWLAAGDGPGTVRVKTLRTLLARRWEVDITVAFQCLVRPLWSLADNCGRPTRPPIRPQGGEEPHPTFVSTTREAIRIRLAHRDAHFNPCSPGRQRSWAECSCSSSPARRRGSGEVLAGPVREVGFVKLPLQDREEADEGADVTSVHGVGGWFPGARPWAQCRRLPPGRAGFHALAVRGRKALMLRPGLGPPPERHGLLRAVRVTPPHDVADDGAPVGGSSLVGAGEYAARWWWPSTLIAMG